MYITVLGTTEIESGALDEPLSRRDRKVLGALTVLRGEPLTTEQLADALWGDEPPKSATKVVQGSVMRLRRALGTSAIETTPNGYRLTLDGESIDADVFEGVVARARELASAHEPERAASAYLQALSLWRGAPLPELQEWDPARAESARLLEVRRSVEEELVEVRMASGRSVEAVADARNLVTREPFREHRWSLLALALYRAGRQREALESLRRARSTLIDELGLDPGPELVALERQILQQDPALLDVPDAPAPHSSTCPYPGLRPFGVEQAELFTGRESAVEVALGRLDQFPLLVICGGSGSGKSSLARAGLVSALRASGSTVAVTAPGVSPVASLTTALSRGDLPTVVVVDQLEELFASPYAGDVAPFLRRLITLVEEGTRVVVTLRADYLGSLSELPAFARMAERGLMLLNPMNEEELRRAIEEPARLSGLVLERGLVDLLVRDVLGEAGGLPLLSHALAETWVRRDHNVLTVEGYNRTGGIRGAVAQSAERLYDSLPTVDRAGLRAVLHRLVTPSAAGEPVAARVPTRVFAGTEDALRLLDLLVRARLVTTSADSATIAHESLVRAWPRLRSWLDEDVEGQRILQHLQVAADGWDASGRPDDELYRGARLQTAIEWRVRVLPLLASAESEFLEVSVEHTEQEELQREASLRAERRTNRNLRLALVGLIGVLVVALVAGSLAAANGRRAGESADAALASAIDADAGRLAFASQVTPSLDLSLLLARQAVQQSPTSAMRANLLAALMRNRVVSSFRPGFEIGDRYHDNQVSPDGTRALIDGGLIGEDRAVYLVDTTTGRLVSDKPLVTHDVDQDFAYPAGFINNGRDVVVSRDARNPQSGTKELISFDARTGVQRGDPVQVPESASGGFFNLDRLRISPDGQTLTSVLSRQARVWTRKGQGWSSPRVIPLPTFPNGDISDQDVAAETRFSDDGRVMAARIEVQGTSPTSYVSVAIDTRSGSILEPPFSGSTELAVAPDGQTLAVGEYDGSVTLRPLSSAGPSIRIPGQGRVNALAWSHDGTLLTIGGVDGGMVVYATNPLAEKLRIAPDGSALSTVAFARGTSELISVATDGRITTRSVVGDSAVLASVATKSVAHLSAGPAGTVIAAGFDNGDVAVFEQTSLRKVRDLSLGPYPLPDGTVSPETHRRVTAVAVTPDGRAVIAADRVGHLRMWSVVDGALLWSRDDVPTSWLAVSPDGTRLVTSEFRVDPQDPDRNHPDWFPGSTQVRLWDLADHRVVMTDTLPGEVDDYGHTPKPRSVAFSPDSSKVAVSFFTPIDLLMVYDAHTGKNLAKVTLDSQADFDSAFAVVFTPDSSRLLVEDGKGVVTDRDPLTGLSGWTLDTTHADYSALAFTSDGGRFVTFAGTSLDIWDASTRAGLLNGVTIPTTNGDGSLAPTSDGHLFIGSERGILRLDTDPERWNEVACRIADRRLTQDEWTRYLAGHPYAPACRAESTGTSSARS